jgi:hypothetical protein
MLEAVVPPTIETHTSRMFLSALLHECILACGVGLVTLPVRVAPGMHVTASQSRLALPMRGKERTARGCLSTLS